MEKSNDIHWYAIRTFHNKATAVCRIADKEAIEWYTPVQDVEVVENERRIIRKKPLLPSLLFLRCTTEFIDKLKRLTNSNILPYCHPGTMIPLVIEDRDMEIFRFVTRTAASLESIDEAQLADKQQVRITGGIFAGSTGHICRIHGTKRFVVRIEGVAAVATTFIPRQFIEPIEN